VATVRHGASLLGRITDSKGGGRGAKEKRFERDCGGPARAGGRFEKNLRRKEGALSESTAVFRKLVNRKEKRGEVLLPKSK